MSSFQRVQHSIVREQPRLVGAVCSLSVKDRPPTVGVRSGSRADVTIRSGSRAIYGPRAVCGPRTARSIRVCPRAVSIIIHGPRIIFLDPRVVSALLSSRSLRKCPVAGQRLLSSTTSTCHLYALLLAQSADKCPQFTLSVQSYHQVSCWTHALLAFNHVLLS